MTSTIAPPATFRIVQSAVRHAMAVWQQESTVVYYCDDQHVLLAVVPDHLYTHHLDEIIQRGGQSLPAVFRVELSCAGVDRRVVTITGTDADQTCARAAIPHFYAVLREPAARAALRVLARAVIRQRTERAVGAG